MRAGLVIMALAVAAAASPAPAEEELLAQESGAILPLDGERALEIRGLTGSIVIREGKASELRFLSTAEKNSKSEIPVSLWKDAGKLILAPVEPEGGGSRAETRRFVEVTVPSGFSVSTRLDRSTFGIFGIAGGVRIEGTQLEVNGSALGTIALRLEGGSVSLRGAADVELRGTGVTAALQNIEGAVDAVLEGGALTVSGASGVNLDLAEARAEIDQVRGTAIVRANGGSVTLSRLVAGLQADLQSSPIDLKDCGGSLDIRTDAPVTFASLSGDLHVDGYGAAVRGAGNSGIAEVKTDSAEVTLGKIEGAVRVQGANLQVSLVEIGGEVYVEVDDSAVSVEKAKAAVDVRSEFGDVKIVGAAGAVNVRSLEGEVRLERVGGPVDVQANGPLVEVDWSSLPASGDSVIRNDNGDVRVAFPSSGGCRVEAKADFGRIESDLPGVRVVDSGDQAVGVLGRQQRPVVRIASRGDVFLSGGAGTP